MQAALQQVTAEEKRVRLEFEPVDEVELTVRGLDHVAACVLDGGSPGGRGDPPRTEERADAH